MNESELSRMAAFQLELAAGKLLQLAGIAQSPRLRRILLAAGHALRCEEGKLRAELLGDRRVTRPPRRTAA